MTANRPTGHRMRCPVCGSRKVIPSLGRLGRRTVAREESGPLPIAGASEHSGEMPAFTWRCRVCRTSMRPSHGWARSPLWKRRKPLQNWMLRRGSSGRVAGT